MIGISRQTDYAARLVLHLAALEADARVSIAEISKLRLLPVAFVRRLAGSLVKAGILHTVRGTGGGISLARPASEISLLDVIEAVEGGIFLNQCLDGKHICPLSNGCPVQAAWAAATKALEDHLAGVRFDALARDSEAHLAAHLSRHAAVRKAASACTVS
ncbi:RrF2 family transcriptional regulator [Geothrix fuzhouensis]|uniref:RrF2 family transcriptional regulator n=1 Tax=Geothrix fuzhouensis TaxID=2966451 RepID=UPI0021494267|nr:Rrf2 family transcriptional regulator [Geothrix fuzhouensis]